MTLDRYDAQPPPWLEDEILLIETSGEMPEVALAESLRELGPLDGQSLAHLHGAVIRAYLKILQRDLDYSLVGLPPFRGLERASCNLGRLESFLRRQSLSWPPRARGELAALLDGYLASESSSLAVGRPWSTASASQVRELAQALGLDLAPHADLLARLEDAPAPDFLAIRALIKLDRPEAAAKRRREKEGLAFLEVVDAAGQGLACAQMPLLGPADVEDPENRARVELVWRLLDLPVA